jgi:hypothetical protein
MHLLPVVEGNRTFIEWSVKLDTAPDDAERWLTLFQSWIPDWTHSLERALVRPRSEAMASPRRHRGNFFGAMRPPIPASAPQ